MSRFDDAFARVVGEEGGYINDPRDPGGETKYGISKREFPAEDIADLTLERAKEIYRAKYWDQIRGDDLPVPVDEFAFDFAVNSGVVAASKALQLAVGALPDGKVGQRTVDAVKSKDPMSVVRLMFVSRALLLANNHNLETYGHGWYARLFDKTAQAIKETA